MSKLDELDKGFREMRHLFYSSAEYERVKDFARKYYDLGKLEEREALKKMVEKNCRYFCKGKTTKQLPVCPHANLLNELNK